MDVLEYHDEDAEFQMEEKTFHFKNKVAAQVPQKRSVFKHILIISGLLFVLITVINIVLEGVSSIDFITGIFLPIFLIWRGTDCNIETVYSTVPTTVSIQDDSVVIDYQGIKRHIEGEEIVSEYYTFRKDDLTLFQYDASEEALRLCGTPLIKIIGALLKEEDCRFSHSEQEIVLYLPKGKATKLIKEIENCLHFKAEILESF